MLYYTASPVKFILLSVCTFKAYEFYWFYKNWQLYKKRTGRRIMPMWRATFAPLWAYSSFKDIRDRARERGIPVFLHPAVLAVSYFLLLCAHKLPDPFNLVAVLTFAPLLIMNNKARVLDPANPDFRENRRLGFRGWLLVLFGGLFFTIYVAVNFIDVPALLRKQMENMPESPYSRMLQITG